MATLRRYVSGKIHGIIVMSKNLDYHGSVTVSQSFLSAVEMQPYEMVHVVNLNNGKRWQTYLLESEEEKFFSLNGGGARLGEVGDRFILFTEVMSELFEGAFVIELDCNNEVIKKFTYTGNKVNDETFNHPW